MKWYSLSIQEVEKVTRTKHECGLSASEVENRLREIGYNELEERKKPSLLLMFLEQFKDFMVLVLSDCYCYFRFIGRISRCGCDHFYSDH